MSIIMSPTMLVDSLIDADKRLYEYCSYAQIASLQISDVACELKLLVASFYPDMQGINKVDWLQIAEDLMKQ